MNMDRLKVFLSQRRNLVESGRAELFSTVDHGEKTLADELGMIVRETWVQWACEQDDVLSHPHWLTAYENLDERDKDVDRRIGLAVMHAVLEAYGHT